MKDFLELVLFGGSGFIASTDFLFYASSVVKAIWQAHNVVVISWKSFNPRDIYKDAVI